MQVVKGKSSEWINDQKFVKGHFSWQEGYGGFSYGRSQLDRVINTSPIRKDIMQK